MNKKRKRGRRRRRGEKKERGGGVEKRNGEGKEKKEVNCSPTTIGFPPSCNQETCWTRGWEERKRGRRGEKKERGGKKERGVEERELTNNYWISSQLQPRDLLDQGTSTHSTFEQII
jgi:hypothetical protein